MSTVGYGKSSRSGDDPWELVPDEADTARALLDSSGRITHWNDGARRLLGHTAARMLGRSAAELLADPVVVTAPSRHERPLPWRGTVELRHRDGRRLTVRLLAHRLRQQEGGFEGWLLVSPLVGTERTEEDNRLPRPAFRYAPNALALYDTEIRLRRANQAMEEVIGLTEGEARGLRLSEIGGKPQSIELEEQLRQVLESGRPRDVRTRLRTGGEPREHAWLGRIAPMWDARGELVGVALSAVDITGEDRAQALLQLVNDASSADRHHPGDRPHCAGARAFARSGCRQHGRHQFACAVRAWLRGPLGGPVQRPVEDGGRARALCTRRREKGTGPCGLACQTMFFSCSRSFPLSEGSPAFRFCTYCRKALSSRLTTGASR